MVFQYCEVGSILFFFSSIFLFDPADTVAEIPAGLPNILRPLCFCWSHCFCHLCFFGFFGIFISRVWISSSLVQVSFERFTWWSRGFLFKTWIFIALPAYRYVLMCILKCSTCLSSSLCPFPVLHPFNRFLEVIGRKICRCLSCKKCSSCIDNFHIFLCLHIHISSRKYRWPHGLGDGVS